MKFRAEIKAIAKERFRNQYGITVGAGFLIMFLMGCVGWTFIGTLLLVPPLTVGFAWFNIKVYKGQQADIGDAFTGFGDFGRNIAGMLWMWLFTFLWSLLFFIPGIVKGIAYSMTPYILADTKNVSATDALKLSMRMTQGYKGEIFVMILSFLGWGILSAMTGGLLWILYVGPYWNASLAGLYQELKANALAKGVIRPEELA